jgi:hypothetical protein
MSNKLVKDVSRIYVPGEDDVIAKIVIKRNGQLHLEAPTLHPRDICKMLSNLQYDLIFASLQPIEAIKIEQPPILEKV